MRQLVAEEFTDRRVLEVACGTGWWTEVLAGTARSVVATDINEEVLALAKGKPLDRAKVFFQRCDAFQLDTLNGPFDAGFAAFWWSHLTRADLRRFLRAFHLRLQPGSTVVFLDNIFVAGSSTPISRRDEDGNTYQQRQLDDGSTTEVLKNFPPDDEIAGLLAGVADHLEIDRLVYYWRVRYTLKG